MVSDTVILRPFPPIYGSHKFDEVATDAGPLLLRALLPLLLAEPERLALARTLTKRQLAQLWLLAERPRSGADSKLGAIQTTHYMHVRRRDTV